jgi:hypothetical protein
VKTAARNWARLLAFVAASISCRAFGAEVRARANLQWHRSAQAEACLDASTLANAVESGLDRTVFGSVQQADLIVKVNLERPDAEHWLAEIDLEDNQGRLLGHRRLHSSGRSCGTINESLALIVSLMVDVTRESLHQAPPVASPLPQPRFQLQPSTVVGPEPSWRANVFVLDSVCVGQPPGLTDGVSLAGEIGPRRTWLVAIRMTAWAPKQVGIDGAGARFWLGSGEVDLCGSERSLPRLDNRLCIGPAIGILGARAIGFDMNRAETSLFTDLILRLSTIWWVSPRFGLHLGLGAGLPLEQREYFGTRADGSRVRLLSRPWLVPLADFGVGMQVGQ